MVLSATSSNQGHSGYTTLDSLPGTEAFKAVEAAAGQAGGKVIFSLMLGTNDSAVKGPNGRTDYIHHPTFRDRFRTHGEN